MKRTNSFFSLLCFMVFAISCSPNDNIGTVIEDGEYETPDLENKKVLVAYFSRAGNTDFPSDVDATSSASLIVGENGLRGTTEVVADFIIEMTGADKLLIRTENPYPTDYDALVDQNHQEQADGYLPPLDMEVVDMNQYGAIFIGYPIWAMTLPNAIRTFISDNNLEGKIIIPFCTHAGYGAGRSFDTIRGLCAESTVLNGIAVHTQDAAGSESQLREWLQAIGILK